MNLADTVTGYKRRAVRSLGFRHTNDNVRYVQHFSDLWYEIPVLLTCVWNGGLIGLCTKRYALTYQHSFVLRCFCSYLRLCHVKIRSYTGVWLDWHHWDWQQVKLLRFSVYRWRSYTEIV